MIKHVCLLVLTLSLWNCNSLKKVKSSPRVCMEEGVVKNFSKLDGCKLLIETNDGTLLRPIEVPEGVYLRAEQRISFSYEAVPEALSICMREKMSVRLTCFELLE